MSNLLYLIVGPDGHPMTRRLGEGSVPLIFATSLAAHQFRTTQEWNPEQYTIVVQALVDPGILANLRITVQRLNRRAQKAEGRLTRMARRIPPAWRSLLYQEALAHWRRRRPTEAPPPPDLERYRLALAYAVQALWNLAGDRFATAKTAPTSALYLKCADDHLSDPGCTLVRIHDNPIRGETRPTSCPTSPSPSLSSVPQSSTISL